MGHICKHFVLTVFLSAILALPSFAFAETNAAPSPTPAKVDVKTNAKTDVKVDAKPEVKADVKVETKTETKSDAKPVAPKSDAKPAPAPAKTADELAGEARAKEILEKANRKIDMNNLPKNLTSILPHNNETFVVAVGETKPIAAARQVNCTAKEAPTWEVTKPRLPPTNLVTFSDGGAFERNSKRCKGPVPARAVFAKGIKTGSDRIVIFGAMVTIIVK